MEFNTLSAAVNQSHAYDAVIMGFTRGRPDPFPRFWRSDGIHPFQRSVVGPISPEQARADELAARIIGSNDDDKRESWMRELQNLINEQA